MPVGLSSYPKSEKLKAGGPCDYLVITEELKADLRICLEQAEPLVIISQLFSRSEPGHSSLPSSFRMFFLAQKYLVWLYSNC